MKKVIVILFILLIGCSPYIRQIYEPVLEHPIQKNYNYSFEKVWPVVLQRIAEYPLTIIEKESGIINTDWIGVGQDTVLCELDYGFWGGGRVDKPMPVESRQRLNILVLKKSNMATTVKIIRYWQIRPFKRDERKREWVKATQNSYFNFPTDTKRENQILNEIARLLKQ